MSNQAIKSDKSNGCNKSDNNADPVLDRILSKLRPFQREAFDFCTEGKVYSRQWSSSSSKQKSVEKIEYDKDLLGKGRILLADEMGLGKTVTSLAIMTKYRSEWPLLIICPASLRHTWPTEIEKFLPSIPPQAVYIIKGFDDVGFSKRSDIQIVVATYSLLQKRSAAARTLQDECNFQCIIVDESHNLKQKNSQRTQFAMPLLQRSRRLVLLSGTPALARPVELWPQVYCIAPKLFGKYTPFTRDYCNARRGRFGWDVSGLSNPKELHSKLRQIMVRRLKSDVLTELPPKQRSIVPTTIGASHKKECQETMTQLEEARISVQELLGQEAKSADMEAKRLLMQAYQASGIGKARAVCDYLEDWLAGSGSQKVLVFCHHKAVMDALEQSVAKTLKGRGHIRIDGSVPSDLRAQRVRQFQTTPSVRVALLSMTAAGVGLTLTAASTVFFAELHWTPGVLAQAEDRCHRIGQANAVQVLYFVAKDQSLSVDMQLWGMLGRKVGTLGRVIDGSKGVTMNAKEAAQTDGANRPRLSVEDELTNFFAMSAEAQEKPKEPAQGSILNFFKKASERTTDPGGRKPLESSTPRANRSLSNVPGTVSFSSHKPKPSPASTWTCGACTYINNKKTGRLSCEMCGTPYITPPTGSARSVTPNHKPVSSEVDLIEIEDSPEIPKQSNPSPEVISIDDVSHGQDNLSVVTPGKRSLTETLDGSVVLKFSVSKNSGRVAIHYRNGESSLVNFDISEILRDNTANTSMGNQLSQAGHRTRVAAEGVPVLFNEDALAKVLQGLTTEHRGPHTSQQLCSGVKHFVRNYLELREVEKKALKDSGKCVSAFRLRQAIARLMADETARNFSTERYAGGAKERAIENKSNGIASEEDNAVLAGEACAWCASALPRASRSIDVSSTYCSQECAEQGRLRRGGMYASTRVRAQVFALERGICDLCGVDAHALFLRISALQPAERLNALCSANWKLPSARQALERLLHDPKEGDFWQADHIQAVAEGGGGCGLENLRTLCTPCHREETRRLRAHLRLRGPAELAEGKRKQMDIRSAFSGGMRTPSSGSKRQRK